MLLVNDLLDAFMDDGTSILELVPVQNEVGNTHYVYTLSQENSRCCPDALCEQLQKCEKTAAVLLQWPIPMCQGLHPVAQCNI